jgi:hypothetical protein
MNPLDSFKILPNMPPCILAMLLGIRGPNLVLNPFGDQAVFALQEGIRAVSEGEVEAALVGAADTPSAPSTLVYLYQSGHLQFGAKASPAAAYLVLEPVSPTSVHPRIVVNPTNSISPWIDPLAPRLGRTFAAAPMLAAAAACLGFLQDVPLPGIRIEGAR